MGTCFVMQPFDGNKFDKRYEDIFKPAIIAAGLVPYRVDKDASVSIPIDEIERGIRDAQICLAEITEDNPNVWFELGYAIAANKEVVLVCSKERTSKFPFDVQHRTIIHYSTGSLSDYTALKKSLTAKLEAYVKKQESLAESVPKIQQVTTPNGLAEHEVVAIAVLTASLDHPSDTVSVYRLKQDMEKSGYTNVAASLAMKSLEKKGYLLSQVLNDYESQSQFHAYSLTDEGWDWVLQNQNRFKFKIDESPRILPSIGGGDDIPF